jgi:hypothetical protein
MKRRILMITAGIAVALTAAVAPSALAATSAPHAAAATHSAAAPAAVHPEVGNVQDTTICAHTNTAYCVDIQGANAVGTKIWLYPNGANDHWDIVAAPQGCQFDSLGCYWFEDAQDTSLCMSTTGSDGAPIELEKCGDTGGWYNEGSYILGNGAYGEAGNLDAQAIGTHDYLYGLSAADGGKYQQFTVYGWN